MRNRFHAVILIATGWLCAQSTPDLADAYLAAAARARQSGDQAAEATSLHAAGRIFNSLSQRAKAYEALLRAVDIRRGLGLAEEADSLAELGEAWRTLGRDDKAAEAFRRALAIYTQTTNLCGLARANFELGILETRDTAIPFARSIPRLKLAATQYAACGDAIGEADAISRWAINQTETGSWTVAMHALDRAQRTYEQSGDLARLARLHYDRGLLHVILLKRYPAAGNPGNTTEARTLFRRAYELFRNAGNRQGQLSALLAWGNAERQLGNTEEAVRLLSQAVDGIEASRAAITDRDIRMSYFAIKQDYHLHYVTALLDMHARYPHAGYDTQAYEASESRRARLLYETLSSDAAQPTVDPTALRNLLGPHDVLLEFSQSGTANSNSGERYCLWIATNQGIRLVRLTQQRDIVAAVREISRRIQSATSASDTQLAQALRTLSNQILAPVWPHLKGKRVIIVPDAPLNLIPFPLLPNPLTGKPIGLTNEIVTVPSASLLAAMRAARSQRSRPPNQIAVFADPVFDRSDPRLPANRRLPAPQHANPSTTRGRDSNFTRLPFSRREARAIASLAGEQRSMLALDFQASKENVLRAPLGDYRILHFATHGIMDDMDHRKSGLMLSMLNEAGNPTDGFLRADEITSLRLRCDLAVLSSCESGAGMDMRGEAVLGLGYLFLYAGAKSVVASLWKVDDQASAEFMRLFYSAMLGPRRLPPSTALLHARKAMAAHPRWRAPIHWAGFFLQGDWR